MEKKKKGLIVLLLAGAALAAARFALPLVHSGAEKEKKDEVKDEAAPQNTEPEKTAAAAEPENTAETKKAQAEALATALSGAKSYIDRLTIHNSINDPEQVVSTWGRTFTWDNEKRQKDKAYLYDWSYYNGVVFEGLDDVYDVTGDTVYSDYVTKYLSGLIDSDGSWRMLEQGQAAGYTKEHGLDCYKTASILLDYYDITGDDRYLKKAEELYKDLQDAKGQYMSDAIGGNYYHTWDSVPEYAVWLDGLYMAQPFMAEYAARYDKAELDKIAERFAWVDKNMYNSETGLYHHAAGADKNSGSYWLRSIGWYIAAMVDVMEYMEGENLENMKASLKRLVDGMLPYQDKESGMWTNYVRGTADGANNRLETSGTSLMVYGMMKAINHGWLDASYADMAVRAFEGMCNEKIIGEDLTDICYIGDPGRANARFYDNEGKGVGPFIMAYAEMLKYSK